MIFNKWWVPNLWTIHKVGPNKTLIFFVDTLPPQHKNWWRNPSFCMLDWWLKKCELTMKGQWTLRCQDPFLVLVAVAYFMAIDVNWDRVGWEILTGVQHNLSSTKLTDIMHDQFKQFQTGLPGLLLATKTGPPPPTILATKLHLVWQYNLWIQV